MGALDDAPAPSATKSVASLGRGAARGAYEPAAGAAAAAAAPPPLGGHRRRGGCAPEHRAHAQPRIRARPSSSPRDHRCATRSDAPEVADVELDRDLEPEFHGFGDHPVQREPTVSSGDGAGPAAATSRRGRAATRPSPRRTSCARTAGNQPAAMGAIAGLPGLAGGATARRRRGGGGGGGGGAARAATPRRSRRRRAVRQSRRDMMTGSEGAFSGGVLRGGCATPKPRRRATAPTARRRAAERAATPAAGRPGTWTRPRGGARCPRKASFWLCARSTDEQRASVERVWPEPAEGGHGRRGNEENAAPAPAPRTRSARRLPRRRSRAGGPADVAYPTALPEAAAGARGGGRRENASVAAADANADAARTREAEKEGVADGRASASDSTRRRLRFSRRRRR